MLKALISLAIIFIIILINEWYWRKRRINNEISRKIVHISVATFVAFWPYYMSYHYIELIAISFFVVVFASRKLKFINSIHSVKRKTIGDLVFPISIGLLALLTTSKPIFSIAMLHMGFTDGMAAIIGVKYGKKNFYKIFGQLKSIVGTLSFILVSFIILLTYKYLNIKGLNNLTWGVVVALPFVSAAVENLSPFGTDDLTVPLLVLAVLRWV